MTGTGDATDAGAPREPALVFVITGPRRRARLRLRGSFFVVGRGEPFPVFHDDPMLSREHLAVVAVPGGARARDLGSRNGVTLNGERLARYAEVNLRPGDVLVAGQTELRLLTEEEAAREAAPAAPETAREDEHTVDEQGRTQAVRAVDPAATDEAPAPADDPLATASGDLPPDLEPDDDDLPGDVTGELDVPALPAADAADDDGGEAPTASLALPDQPTAIEVPAAGDAGAEDDADADADAEDDADADAEDEPEVLEG
ncbi:MAG: FHA domain-containing protein [Planctomycetota bacterium]|nr:FHA domain-containing protein [Planctomycetota bacterium]